MNSRGLLLVAIASLGPSAYAQTAGVQPDQPQETTNATVAPATGPSGAMPSSGGYRPPTQSGSGDEPPVRLEAIPGRQIERKSALPPPAPMTRLAAKTENGITYLCGGIGQDEANEMKESARDYDLMLTFAARDGSYLADVNVDIADAQNKSLLKTTCNAPIMLVDIGKSGTYRIRAETGGSTVSKLVRVQPQNQGKSLVLVWPVQAVRGLVGNQPPEEAEEIER
jgi:hypothetical protein